MILLWIHGLWMFWTHEEQLNECGGFRRCSCWILQRRDDRIEDGQIGDDLIEDALIEDDGIIDDQISVLIMDDLPVCLIRGVELERIVSQSKVFGFSLFIWDLG